MNQRKNESTPLQRTLRRNRTPPVNRLSTNKLNQDRPRIPLRLCMGRRRDFKLQGSLFRPLVLHPERRERTTARQVLSLNQHAHSFSSRERLESPRARQALCLRATR